MAISTADFKNGMCIEFNGKLCTIVEFQHVKPGKGSAFVRTKLRDIKTGRIIDNTFNAGVKVESVRLETKKLQYLYNDGADFNFMDNDTFEQMAISTETVGDAAKWLKENDEASLLYAGDELISIEPQMFVELEVTHTEPGFKGDTATNTTKPATLETGVEVQVPTFVEIGDVLQIDTRDGRFINACSKRETPTRLNGNEGADGRPRFVRLHTRVVVGQGEGIVLQLVSGEIEQLAGVHVEGAGQLHDVGEAHVHEAAFEVANARMLRATISAKVVWESPSEVRTSRSRLPKSADRRWTRGSLRAIFSFLLISLIQKA